MTRQIYNYSAFYVDEPFSESNLGPHSARDFCYYDLLKAWKSKDNTFPFLDAHGTTYNVRDDSDWNSTLKPRLQARLNNSKNIILFLSSVTKYSTALNEEIDFGINHLGLPVIAVYPEYEGLSINGRYVYLHSEIKCYWNRLPIFRANYLNVPTMHMSCNKKDIEDALSNPHMTVQGKSQHNGHWLY